MSTGAGRDTIACRSPGDISRSFRGAYRPRSQNGGPGFANSRQRWKFLRLSLTHNRLIIHQCFRYFKGFLLTHTRNRGNIIGAWCKLHPLAPGTVNFCGKSDRDPAGSMSFSYLFLINAVKSPKRVKSKARLSPGLTENVEKVQDTFSSGVAACCVHNLSASGGQIPHLQAEMYFLPCTRPGRKCLILIRHCGGKLCEAFSTS